MNTNAAAIAVRAHRDRAPRVQRAQSRIAEGWWAKEYLDDGIFHVELSDATGCIQVLVATAAGLFWALPIGFPTARVSLPNWRLKLPDEAKSSHIYACPAFSLIRHSNGEHVVWYIQTW